jgi:hypothetical protein
MSTKHQPFISLDSCINDYLAQSEQGVHKYFKLFHIAFRGMDTLGLDFFYQIKSVKLPVNANLTVTLPADYLNYSKIGVLNSVGEIIPLSYNNNLTTYMDLSPNRLQQTQDDTLGQFYNSQTPIWYNYWNGYTFDNVYGVPSGSPFVGSFKVDIQNGVIVLGENFGYDYLMVEYVATPLQNQEYYLPMQFREAMIAWMAWQDIANVPSSRKGNLGDKRDRKSNFYNERRLANARYRPVDLIEAYEWGVKTNRLTVKI